MPGMAPPSSASVSTIIDLLENHHSSRCQCVKQPVLFVRLFYVGLLMMPILHTKPQVSTLIDDTTTLQ